MQTRIKPVTKRVSSVSQHFLNSRIPSGKKWRYRPWQWKISTLTGEIFTVKRNDCGEVSRIRAFRSAIQCKLLWRQNSARINRYANLTAVYEGLMLNHG